MYGLKGRDIALIQSMDFQNPNIVRILSNENLKKNIESEGKLVYEGI